MGYTTRFTGSVSIEPPLNEQEIAFLNKFSETRRMDRRKGPYYVDNAGYAGQDHEEDIVDYNQPPRGQPGLWCKWVADDKGKKIKWSGQEKFYDSEEWMAYIINHFIGDNPIARQVDPERFSFLQGHVLNGLIKALGEESDDRWLLAVGNNQVKSFQKADLALAEDFIQASVAPEIQVENERDKKIAKHKKML